MFVRRSRTTSRWYWLCGDAACHTFPHYGANYPTASAALDAACEHIRAAQPTPDRVIGTLGGVKFIECDDPKSSDYPERFVIQPTREPTVFERAMGATG